MIRYDPSEDAYALLGVRADASQREIEAAYRKAVLTWHPDKCPAPDAAEHFHRIQAASRVLRDAAARREYDRMRAFHRPPAPRRRPAPERAPEPHVPLAAAPPWMRAQARVVRDGVMFALEPPPKRFLERFALLGLLVSIGAAFAEADVAWAGLAIVFYMIMRVSALPREQRTLAWAKVVPGQREAEFTAMDRHAGILLRYSVPFERLSVAVIARAGEYAVEILGFPRRVPLLKSVRDVELARRCAREASAWLGLPLARAA